MLEVTPVDRARVDTLLLALKKGTWELEGEEILAFAQVFAWASGLKERLAAALAAQPPAPPAPTLVKRGKEKT